MNVIDAIEGIVKTILVAVHRKYVDDCLDDSDYIGEVKLIIEAAGTFLAENQTVIDTPDRVKRILYHFAKQIWLKNLSPDAHHSSASSDKTINPDDLEYYDYYFGYIYEHGIYPR